MTIPENKTEANDCLDPELMIAKIIVGIQETISVLHQLNWIQNSESQREGINNAIRMLISGRRDMNEALELLCSGH